MRGSQKVIKVWRGAETSASAPGRVSWHTGCGVSFHSWEGSPFHPPVWRKREGAATSGQGVGTGCLLGLGPLGGSLRPTWALVSPGADEGLLLEQWHERAKRRLIWGSSGKQGEVQPLPPFLWCPTSVGPALRRAGCAWVSKQRKRMPRFVFFSLKNKQCFLRSFSQHTCKARVSGGGVCCVSRARGGSSVCDPGNCVKWAGREGKIWSAWTADRSVQYLVSLSAQKFKH